MICFTPETTSRKRRVLFLQKDWNGALIHVVWGIPKGHDNLVVLVTCLFPVFLFHVQDSERGAIVVLACFVR